MSEPPNHRIDLTLTLGVNTPDDLVAELHGIADRLDREGCDRPRNITSGWPGGSCHLEIKHDPTMTHERFVRELMDWAQERRAEKKGGAA